MRAQNEPPETVVRLVRGEIDGEPTDVPGAFRVARVDERGARRRTHLAAEPRLAARGARSSLRATASAILDSCAAPGGKATMLHGDVVAVELNEARARELERERAPARRRRTCASSTPTRPTCRRSSTASTARSSTRRAPASACWRAGPTCAGARSRSRSSSSSCCAPPPSGSSPAARSSTASARSTRTRTKRSSTRPGSTIDPTLGDEWPQFRHPRRPEFLLTLPHVHGTSGFFIARLRGDWA